ncbi:MAG: YbbR-like domain-containing protein [Deltaproteobacteria bacterium]|nr:YbbR-like domain-containing protein [Deltaproteobacteria bacterium]
MKSSGSGRAGQIAGHEAEGVLRGLVFRNLRLKILALVFSAALWFLVIGEKSSEVGLFVPLVVRGIPDDMMIADNADMDIEVRVTGPRSLMTNLSPSEIEAALDVSGAKEGMNTYRISAGDIKTPGGIKVVRVRPSSVDIRIERLRQP